jgi:hypothetical protein
MEPGTDTVPSIVFIVPYRHRRQHRKFFTNYIEIVMAGTPRDKWEFYFSHQVDDRPFNRGAVKNIGFLAIKEKYPDHYENMTLVFNDVDTLPYDKDVFHYDTPLGVIKHFYGYDYALGGVFSIKGADFEALNGFPNYWAWGQEDNCIQHRAMRLGIPIDRRNFFKIGDHNVLQLFDGLGRTIMKGDIARTRADDGRDGLRTIRDLNFEFVDHDIVIRSFEVPRKWSDEDYQPLNIVKGRQQRKVGMMGNMYRS